MTRSDTLPHGRCPAAGPGARTAPAAFDECWSPDGVARPHWQPLLAALARLGHDELAARAENARRVLGEHGVTCFVAGPNGGTDEPWQLDLLPLVLSREEWAELEAGVVQRAELLSRILADLYSTQRLVRDGFVPAPLIFANPGYLRPCQAVPVRDGAYLQTYAVDLARAPDGRWWVLADRTQSPAGLGFALENRSVSARVLPEAIREIQPRPLSDQLRVLRETLRRGAPPGTDNPAIALLTPGPRNEAYFEHAYLARLLGLTLVEGDDLTVRHRRLLVKTLEGLRGVDVLLRRVNDAFCDPLELRSDSLLGAPGLLESVRAGHVQVGNALGAGLVESPAFLPFLPNLCRHLLGEELRLPSVATWWCGQPREQSHVHEHLDSLLVRPAFSLAGAPVSPAELEPSDREQLEAQMRLQPHDFVGQERIRLSCAPVWSGFTGDSRPLIVRVFALFDGHRFTVLPGGLARVLDQVASASATFPLSGLTKDVWVLPSDRVEGAAAQALVLAGAARDATAAALPSRAADNLFWLGRYTERLEQLVRTTRYGLQALAEAADEAAPERLAPLRELFSRLGLAGPAAPGSARSLQDEILALLYEETSGPGLRELLRRIHQAAFAVRDRLSADTWRILNRLEPDARRQSGHLPLVEGASTLHALVLDLAAFSGMEMENMTRGHGWTFLDLGRRLERGWFTARLLAALLETGPHRERLLEPVLEIADSVITHRRRYFIEPRLETTLELLGLDAANPRSLAFQVASLEQHAGTLPEEANPQGVAALKRQVAQLAARLRALATAEPDQAAATLAPAANAATLKQLAAGLEALSELLTQVYFSHVPLRVN